MNTSYVIGVDMGGTNTAFGIVDARGKIWHRHSMATAHYTTAEEYVDALCLSLSQLVDNAGLTRQIKGIGIGTPNGNMYTGCIERAANIPWAQTKVVPLAKMISDKMGLSCTLTNDANAAALGEMAYGDARGMKDFIVITLGTGVGSGIVCNGELVLGHDGFAGELGHTISVLCNGRDCGCGRSGCLETYTSAKGVARTAREYLELLPDEKSLLRNIQNRPITSKDVFEAAEKGDTIALKIFDYTGRMLGRSFCDFIAFFSPEAIILFGGLALSGKYILEPIENEINTHVMPIFKGKTKIILSSFNDSEAAILGASASVW